LVQDPRKLGFCEALRVGGDEPLPAWPSVGSRRHKWGPGVVHRWKGVGRPGT